MKQKDTGKKPESSEVEKLQGQVKEYKDTLQHLQAEFENFRKRSEKENAEFKRYATAAFIKSFLPIVDSFESALKNTSEKDKFVKGMELIYAQLHQFLHDHGVKDIEALGKQFDPYKHEVLLQEKGKDDLVLEELQKGYMLNDVVIRHSKVKVGKNEQSREKQN